MRKVDATVLRETRYIAGCALVMSVVMQIVFIVLGLWDASVPLGNLLGLIAAVGNFFLMGLTIQDAVAMDKDAAKKRMKFSQTLRMFALMLICVLALTVNVFHPVAAIAPLLFPRIGIALRPLFHKNA